MNTLIKNIRTERLYQLHQKHAGRLKCYSSHDKNIQNRWKNITLEDIKEQARLKQLWQNVWYMQFHPDKCNLLRVTDKTLIKTAYHLHVLILHFLQKK